ncbi:hypothetical protein I6G97_00445 [Edwardsiella hoshinae]|uniref:hypothetical protein n=1 Tax=Edwardsiella hoshinae TaxID=93378 RepID=UPI0011E5EE52|nr:hypothetical protein [Edwardsiella hoshinae]QPR28172.1 hypothetical protein I6G97_00445 [Edwardsiella hoshinae]
MHRTKQKPPPTPANATETGDAGKLTRKFAALGILRLQWHFSPDTKNPPDGGDFFADLAAARLYSPPFPYWAYPANDASSSGIKPIELKI